MVDGDDTYPMEYAAEMVDKVLNHNADMVVGDRLSSTYFTENKRPFHNMGSARTKGESGFATLPLCKKRNSAKLEKTSLSTDAF